MHVVNSIVANMKQFSSTSAATASAPTSSDLPTVNLISYLPVSKGVAAAMIRVISRQEPSALNIAVATGNLFDQKLKVIPGSIICFNRDLGVMTASCKLTTNMIQKPIYDENPQGFRSISRNMFMDDVDNSMWKLVENNGNRVLVRNNSVETDEDIETLLSTSSNVTHRSTKEFKLLCSSIPACPKVGTLLSFASEDTCLGFVVDNSVAGYVGVLTASGEPQYITAQQIVTTYDVKSMNLNIPQVSESLSSISTKPSIDTVIAFYRKIFGYNKEFMDAFEKEIRGHRFAQ